MHEGLDGNIVAAGFVIKVLPSRRVGMLLCFEVPLSLCVSKLLYFEGLHGVGMQTLFSGKRSFQFLDCLDTQLIALVVVGQGLRDQS